MSSPRQRLGENVSITRSNIWHSDGTVVLQANTTHQTNLLSKAAPSSSFLDTVMDVQYLLTVLYDPTFLVQTALPLPAIGALIRMGRKYDFANIFKSAVRRLTLEYPATLEDYDSTLALDAYTHVPTRIIPYRGMIFDIISLARENNILSVLPSAYYHSIVNGLDDVLDGILRDDGTLAFLAPVDQHRCIRGREKLLNVQLQPGYSIGWYRSWKPGHDCTGGQCTTLIDARLRDHLNRPLMRALAKFHLNSSLNNNWCATCKQNIHKLNVAARKKTWDELPVFFDLPPWNELTNDL
ncbi:BTB domain-containing protein [Mycena venus]|uniref:BTB domain-containing protein n=1 Tax=Mycena venus TaxID=2733690 RepID=A0A8H7D7H0_9AGAR|nr:BTB domain-containing protein [Mycena venus]